MSLQNGMWHGLRNGIILRNVIYAEWLKKYIKLKSAPFFGINQFAKVATVLIMLRARLR